MSTPRPNVRQLPPVEPWELEMAKQLDAEAQALREARQVACLEVLAGVVMLLMAGLVAAWLWWGL